MALLAIVPIIVWGSGEDLDTGTPYGQLTEEAIQALYSFAKARGIDLKAQYARAHNGERDGLEQILSLSVHFDALDIRARMYGNFVYACLLNLVDSYGEQYFAEALDSQSAQAQQRVRDFLVYPLFQLPQEERETQLREAREELPLISPDAYVFGQHDSLFKGTSN
jgi:hypothetical protein